MKRFLEMYKARAHTFEAARHLANFMKVYDPTNDEPTRHMAHIIAGGETLSPEDEHDFVFQLHFLGQGDHTVWANVMYLLVQAANPWYDEAKAVSPFADDTLLFVVKVPAVTAVYPEPGNCVNSYHWRYALGAPNGNSMMAYKDNVGSEVRYTPFVQADV